MKRNILLLILIILSTSFIYSENINSYSIYFLKMIKIGTDEGELGFERLPGAQISPFTFIVNDNLYIPDPMNYRLNIYNLNIDFIKDIKDSKNILAGAETLFLDSAGNFVSLNHDIGLYKLTPSGDIIFALKPTSIPKRIFQYRNLFLVNNNIFAYDNNDVGIITETGFENRKTIVIDTIQKNENINLETGLEKTKNINFSNLSINLLNNLKNSGNSLIIGDNFYSNTFEKHQNYYNEIKDIRTQVLASRSINNTTKYQDSNAIEINYDDYLMWFIGYDNDHNSYWNAFQDKNFEDSKKQLIVVIDKYGILLDAFQYGETNTMNDPIQTVYPASGAKLAVAPTGDVWFMTASPKGYDFYKVERQW